MLFVYDTLYTDTQTLTTDWFTSQSFFSLVPRPQQLERSPEGLLRGLQAAEQQDGLHLPQRGGGQGGGLQGPPGVRAAGPAAGVQLLGGGQGLQPRGHGAGIGPGGGPHGRRG